MALDPRSRPRREAALPLGRNQWKVGQTFRNRVGPSKGGAQKGFRWARSRGPTAFGRCDGGLRVLGQGARVTFRPWAGHMPQIAACRNVTVSILPRVPYGSLGHCRYP